MGIIVVGSLEASPRLRLGLFRYVVGDSARLGLPFVLDFLGRQRLLDIAVGQVDVLLVLFRRIVEVGPIADQQVHVGHGFVVFLIDIQGLLHVGHAFIKHRTILGFELFADFLFLDRTRIFGLIPV